MTLAEEIEEVKRYHYGKDFSIDDIDGGWVSTRKATAIATILNAVVKGELRYGGDS